MRHRAGPAIVALALTAVSACTHLPDCGDAWDSAKRLVCDARAGLKTAQLELAKRYEAGRRGVPRDLKRAAALYAAAAAFTSGTTFVYSPPVGKAPGSVIPVRTGIDQPGLPEAKYRLGLMHLEGRGVRFDFAKGRKLISEAAAEGWPEAIAKLEALATLPRT